ncbi:FliH/SctL family protein [Cryobacterium fucosi]|nr:FliH/SctL family protein [Cryobacterium fucosi]
MSSDAGFSTLSFPTLRDVNRDLGHEQSRARGHAAGYAAGLRAAADEIDARAARLDAEHAAAVRHGQARVDHAVAMLGAAAVALDERTIPVLRDAENTLVTTALDLAEAIIGHELDDAEKSARFALGRALNHTTAVQPHSVRMNPDDLAVLDESTRAQAGVEFAADPSLARGDAITEFPDGFLDARIGTALARAKAVLQGGAS